MLRTDLPYTRTLTLVLPESEWRALREVEPDAVGWLQLQIRNRLGGKPSEELTGGHSNRMATDFFLDDEY